MNSGENYRYAAMCFRILVNNGITLRSWGYDINCLWGVYIRKCIEAFSDWADKPSLRQAAGATAFPVPCWHAGMHNKACREANTLVNSRFAVDLQANGEPAEQAWSMGGGNKAGRYLGHDCTQLAPRGQPSAPRALSR